ncbi:MAG: ATP-binding protein [Planctomycetota bacterium]|nr:ATP-binding protein [Planctomycetota bacterium]
MDERDEGRTTRDAASVALRPTPPTLIDLQRRLAQSQRLAALGALVARLAHELGTPLHSIAGHVDLVLEDERLPEDARRRIDIIGGEVRRLSRLIRRYLEKLRTPAPAPAPTDVPGLVREVVGLLEPVIAGRGVDLTLDFEAGSERPIPCDREQVEQVVVNLVQNAIDAMPEGGDLAVRVGVAGRGLVISVCDSGHGIAPDIREHVFEPFFSTKEGGRGSGLGLAICREIARAHGGDVLLDSKAGMGTVVTLIIQPRDPVDSQS